jgi:hypothetical protein
LMRIKIPAQSDQVKKRTRRRVMGSVHPHRWCQRSDVLGLKRRPPLYGKALKKIIWRGPRLPMYEALPFSKLHGNFIVAATTGRSGDRVAIGRIAERAGGPRGNRSLTRPRTIDEAAELLNASGPAVGSNGARAPPKKKTPLDGARCRQFSPGLNFPSPSGCPYGFTLAGIAGFMANNSSILVFSRARGTRSAQILKR